MAGAVARRKICGLPKGAKLLEAHDSAAHADRHPILQLVNQGHRLPLHRARIAGTIYWPLLTAERTPKEYSL